MFEMFVELSSQTFINYSFGCRKVHRSSSLFKGIVKYLLHPCGARIYFVSSLLFVLRMAENKKAAKFKPLQRFLSYSVSVVYTIHSSLDSVERVLSQTVVIIIYYCNYNVSEFNLFIGFYFYKFNSQSKHICTNTIVVYRERDSQCVDIFKVNS